MRRLLTPLLLAPLAAGCPVGDCPEGSTVDWADVRPIFEEFCTECHASVLSGGARSDAPSGTNYDTAEAAAAHPTMTWTEIHIDHMPPSGVGLSDDQKALVKEWLACDGPE